MGNQCAASVVNKAIDDHQNIPTNEDNNVMESYIVKHFNKSVRNRELLSSMAIMDEYCTRIDFSKHYFKHGDTSVHYAVRLHRVNFLYYLLEKGYDVCKPVFYSVCT